jgi:hypothetical protein
MPRRSRVEIVVRRCLSRDENYPDPFAVEYGEAYAVNPKELERQVAALSAAG